MTVDGLVEVTISSTDPILIDQMWAMRANGIFERDHDTVVGFDDDATAQTAIAALPTGVRWSLAPSPPLETWDTYAQVVVDGRFILRPPWLHTTASEAATAEQPGIELVIDPGASFGHGGHPTTLLALRSLVDHLKPGDSVLDVGSGSGVLAIAAAKLGASRVIATDIDPTAVTATATNAEANGVAIDVSDTRLHDIAGSFDLVVANMERPTLTAHLQELWKLTGRTLILSGVLAEDPLDLDGLSMASTTVEQLGEWAAITLMR